MTSTSASFRQRHKQPSAMSTSSTASSSTSHRSWSAAADTSSSTAGGGSSSTSGVLGQRLTDGDGDDVAAAPDAAGQASRRSSDGPMRRLSRSETMARLATLLSDDYLGESKPLLLAVPVAIVASFIPRMPAVVVFLLNAAALVPLAALNILTVLRMTKNSRVWGGLLRAIGGNFTEFIASTITLAKQLSAVALVYGESSLVQQTMIGIILNYSLLVLGGSFLHASYGKKDAVFSKTRTSIMSSLVMVTSFCLIIPTVMSLTTASELIDSPEALRKGILNLSHMTATALVLLFFTYLSFRFITHGQFFPSNPGSAQLNPDSRTNTNLDSKPHQYEVGFVALGIILLGSLTCTTVCAVFLLRNMDEAAETLHMTKTFIAFVVFPLIVSSAKSVSIIRHARPEEAGGTQMSRLDFAIRSVMTNVLDTLLFNIPLLVFLGWGLNQPMVLIFGLFDAVVFVLSVTIMTFLVRYGKTTYFESCMLMGTYLSMAIVFFVRPETNETPAPGPQFIANAPPQASIL